MYKLVAIDLDGTLLNSYGEVSYKTRQSIKELIKSGIEVVLTSGRAQNFVKNLALDLGSNNFLISSNGAIIYDIKNNKNLYTNTIQIDKALKIIKFCEDNSIFCSILLDNTIIASSLNFNALCYYSENSQKSEDKKTNISITENIYEYLSKLNKEIFKICVCDNDEIIFSSIIKKLKMIGDINVLDVGHLSKKIIKYGTQYIPISYFYTEITNKNVNKWSSIEYLISNLGINKEQVVAIGDNVNDELMLKNAGLGIIMGNAAPYIKKFADVEVSDNDSDGVAEAIYKYILK